VANGRRVGFTRRLDPIDAGDARVYGGVGDLDAKHDHDARRRDESEGAASASASTRAATRCEGARVHVTQVMTLAQGSGAQGIRASIAKSIHVVSCGEDGFCPSRLAH
jgi:hypothetical protein